ncbi:ABC transporter substrate-binding protein [Brevibacterium marinum]|uniref:Peptide/nickel transport system substrate-binding protein n=2 Tax=Brevibacterium marinum TaxID=418643 RepID=A0A846RXK6_9MICO|nr:ABC transporter substrate-binding protein [Brevibacterium marinum]NJC56155.1 peptide/nickel transport system substrate-binding protein [Brevibacterium marinum]
MFTQGKLRRRLVTGFAGLAAMALVGSIAAAPAQAATEEAEDPSVMRIATDDFIDSFNPFTSFYLMPTNTFKYMYENLVANSAETGDVIEGLATEWNTEEGGKRWTYKIRPEMKWSDGEPLTSEDVAWTYNQMMEKDELSVANGGLVENFAKVEAPDESTVVITLKEPQANNPGQEIPVVPKHVWSKIDKPGEFKNEENTVGSGPFQLESYEANKSVTLKSNPNFWRGEPTLDKIQYRYYTNSDAQVQAIRSGEVDFITGLTPEQFKAIEDADGVETNVGNGRRFSGISINSGLADADGEEFGTGHAALKDKKVRQAIRAGIDIDTLREQVMQDYAQPATSFVPSVYEKWALPEDDPVITGFDVERAKKLLDEAGWKEGSDGIREKDGEKLSLRFLTDADATVEQNTAKFVKPWMKDIGIELKNEASDVDTVSERSTKGDYDMYFSGWSLSPDPDYQLFINTCGSRPDAEGSGGTSQDGYCSEEFDKLYQQQHVELDENKRAELVHQALALHYEDTASITLWYQNQLEAFRSDRFTGFTKQPTDGGIIANQVGYWGYSSVEPASAADASGGGGMGAGGWIGIAAAAIVVIGGGGFLISRRKKSDDRE